MFPAFSVKDCAAVTVKIKLVPLSVQLTEKGTAVLN